MKYFGNVKVFKSQGKKLHVKWVAKLNRKGYKSTPYKDKYLKFRLFFFFVVKQFLRSCRCSGAGGVSHSLVLRTVVKPIVFDDNDDDNGDDNR